MSCEWVVVVAVVVFALVKVYGLWLADRRYRERDQ